MKIYRLTYETFKRDYRGYWSSLEKAIEMLPQCKRFHEVVGWSLPDRREGEDFDWEHNKKLPLKITKERDHLKVSKEDFRWIRHDVSKIDEIKEPGKPYVPAKREYSNRRVESCEQLLGIIRFEELEVDEIWSEQ